MVPTERGCSVKAVLEQKAHQVNDGDADGEADAEVEGEADAEAEDEAEGEADEDAAGTSDPDAMDALMASLVSAVGYCRALTKRLEAMVEAGTIDGASVTAVFSAS